MHSRFVLFVSFLVPSFCCLDALVGQAQSRWKVGSCVPRVDPRAVPFRPPGLPLAKRERHERGARFPVIPIRRCRRLTQKPYYLRNPRIPSHSISGAQRARSMTLPHCPDALGQALQRKRGRAKCPASGVCSLFWLINQITRSRPGRTAAPRWQE